MKLLGTYNTGIPIFKNIRIPATTIYANRPPDFLEKAAIAQHEAEKTASGALSIRTGRFTGRSPKDKYIVRDKITDHYVDWGNINQPYAPDNYLKLRNRMIDYLDNKEVYLQDLGACADPAYRMSIRLLAEKPWSAHFAHNMFLRLTEKGIHEFDPDWHIVCLPGFKADPDIDNTRAENFAIVNFSEKEILIGGTGYTGEIKKSVFTVLNYTLPQNDGVLPMHCSANEGKDGNVAVFFGLSGTGKTTLSSDDNRQLIGDDEHGWSDNGVFNVEGGCYAKCIDLSEEKEPEIYAAVKSGAILENIIFKADSKEPDYYDDSITQNTRVSYPIHHISNAKEVSVGNHPRDIFFLTCDAFGILPPISRLSPQQAMYHFASGYTAKVAGTETGIEEPQATFSACFGAPFLPLHPTKYAIMLGKKLKSLNTRVWLVNTGWTGGAYGEGERISLKYTRAMIRAAMAGELDHVRYGTLDIFNLKIPSFCPGVPTEVLNPRNTWADRMQYDEKARNLAELFIKNFNQYITFASKETINAGPQVMASAI